MVVHAATVVVVVVVGSEVLQLSGELLHSRHGHHHFLLLLTKELSHGVQVGGEGRSGQQSAVRLVDREH